MVDLMGVEIGVFRGFSDSGLEFKAEIVAPYHSDLRPLIGEFLLVDVDGLTALLGRITRFFPVGILSGGQGEDYLTTLSRLGRQVPEDVKEDRLRYNVNLKLLGSLTIEGNDLRFIGGVRQLPHLGARVATPTDCVVKYICSLGCEEDGEPVQIGHLALGDSVFDGHEGRPDFPVHFDLSHLIAKRSFVFARAGYGKSNLVKLLIAKLYERPRNVGMLVFDPEGEYAFTDITGRPGFTDIPSVRNRVLVFTDRSNLPRRMNRFVAGRPRLNLKTLHPAVVVNHCISAEKQETVFASRLRGLRPPEWTELLDLLHRERYRASDEEIASIVELQPSRSGEIASISAIRSNLVPIIGTLHDDASDIVRQVMDSLRLGHVVVVDVSTLSRMNSERLAGIILNEIFHHNQRNFVARGIGDLIRTIVVLEEAQAVLSPKASPESSFVIWAKEGRKYELGAILITQQPGAIANELLSQGDNFFAFHLISASDLNHLKHANSHYSTDIITSIINEPIKGNCYYWSAPDQPFVMCSRILNYEDYVRNMSESEGLETEDEREQVKEITEEPEAEPDSNLHSDIEMTPAEEYRLRFPSIRDELDEMVKEAILEKINVKIHANLRIDDEPASDCVTVYFWNITLELAKTLSEPALHRFGKQFKDSGDWFITEDFLEESLSRLGFLYEEPKGWIERKPYFLLTRHVLELKPDKSFSEQEVLSLTSKR